MSKSPTVEGAAGIIHYEERGDAGALRDGYYRIAVVGQYDGDDGINYTTPL